MPDVIVNTSPLQYLHRLGLLNLLERRYGTIIVPEAVAREIEAGRAAGANVPDLSAVPWIGVESVAAGALQRVTTALGPGEREVLGLSLQKPDPLAVFDEQAARREAARLGVRFTAVMGILLKAKEAGHVSALVPLLDELQRHGFFLDPRTRSRVLKLAGESP